ncbi:MAG: alpha-xylosidase, partial [Alphaproteobacteria bacterium]
LPLYAKPNSLIIFGNNDQQVDYDYSQGFEAHLFSLSDGKEIQAAIVSAQDGSVILEILAQRKANVITVKLRGKASDWSLHLRGIDNVAEVSQGHIQQSDMGCIISNLNGDGEITIKL